MMLANPFAPGSVDAASIVSRWTTAGSRGLDGPTLERRIHRGLCRALRFASKSVWQLMSTPAAVGGLGLSTPGKRWSVLRHADEVVTHPKGDTLIRRTRFEQLSHHDQTTIRNTARQFTQSFPQLANRPISHDRVVSAFTNTIPLKHPKQGRLTSVQSAAVIGSGTGPQKWTQEPSPPEFLMDRGVGQEICLDLFRRIHHGMQVAKADRCRNFTAQRYNRRSIWVFF